MDEMPSQHGATDEMNPMPASSILLVDDEAVITTQLEERLTRMGYAVVGRAASGEEGVEMARRLRPDLILMDIVMPGEMDGIDATEIIGREMAIPVVFLTAYGDDRYIERAKKVNPEGYIIKPYQENEIKAVIEIVMERRKASGGCVPAGDLFTTAIRHMPHAVLVLDGSGRLLSWSRSAARLFGCVPTDSVPGSIELLVALKPSFELRELVDEALSIGENESRFVEVETAGVRKDGNSFPLEMTMAPVRHDGRAMVACVVHDISKYKGVETRLNETLQQKDLIIREIHHRVKNNFQIIVSILNLQSRRITDPLLRGHLDDCQGRVKAMALVHENLHRSGDSERINISAYLQAMVRDIHRAFSHESRIIQIRESMDAVQLYIDQAVPCGIIVNELLTNAFKYAFPAGWSGEAVIRMAVKQLDGRSVEIVVEDNGAGLPEGLDPSAADTLGYSLVKLLVRQLHGTISVGRKNGTRIAFVFDARR